MSRVALLAFLSVGIPTASANTCLLDGPRYLLKSDTVDWSMRIASGQNCIRGIRFSNVVVEALTLVTPPHSGELRLLGPGFSYTAMSTFQGEDSFVLAVSGMADRMRGASTIRVVVHKLEPSSFSKNQLTGDALSGTVAGPIGLTMSPTSPAFFGSSSFSGTDSSQFQIVGSNLATSGAVPASAYSINTVATKVGVGGSPFIQAETVTGSFPSPTGAQKPGPSQAFPFYTCVRNFYVATNGSDSNNGTSPSTPWRTIQNADRSDRTGGDCINVAPGTYAAGALIANGGNLASATGYVVYRCTIMNACTINHSAYGFRINSIGNGPNYVVIDGFTLAASEPVTYGVGVGLFQGNSSPTRTSHHIWVLNNIIFGYGQSGVDMNSGDYLYYIHNLAYNNSSVTCDAQGSGFTIVVPKAIVGYSPTAADLSYAPFHNIVAWNVSHNNMLTRCGSAKDPYDTDGNGIIMDDFANQGSGDVPYLYQSLVAGNVSYSNGGAGISVARSSYVTVANNIAYNNYLDPFNVATFRNEIGIGGGRDNTVINNIAYSVPANSSNDPRCKGINYSTSRWNLPSSCSLQWNAAFGAGSQAPITNSNNVFSNNISFGGSPPYKNQYGNNFWPPDTLNCSTGTNPNKCNVDPLLREVLSDNFALDSGSPAIGYGLEKSYLPAQTIDVGACYRAFASCP